MTGEIEIDETHLYKVKHFQRFGRKYKMQYIWIVGLKERKSGLVLLFPTLKRDQQKIMNIILKHVEIHSTIYSDSFSVYVNNRKFPAESKLMNYGYIHYFVNHKYNFVSLILNTIHINSIEREWRSLKQLVTEYHPKRLYVLTSGVYYFLQCNFEDKHKN